MKYFTVSASSRDELMKTIYKNYGNKTIIFKFAVEEKSKIIPAGGLFKKFKKPKELIEKIHKAYCGLPENQDELTRIEENTKKENQNQNSLKNVTQVENALFKAPNSDENYLELSKEMGELKSLFRQFVEKEAIEEDKEEKITHLKEAEDFLLENDFSLAFAKNFLNSLSLPVNNLDTFKIILKEKLKLNIYCDSNLFKDEQRFFLLMGPTGVGKTTTLAKLAAMAVKEKKKIRFFSFDSYRLGADLQLQKYAKVFERPFHLIQSKEDLDIALKACSDDEIVFMDSAGESLKKEVKLSEINSLLEAIPHKIIKILTLQANSKSKDLIKVKEKFKAYNYDYYIFTKLDESTSMGTILETLYQDSIPLSFICNGQEVPDDIKKANLKELLTFF